MENSKPVAWWKAGLLSRCPKCGEGSLFEGVLKFRESCPKCGDSFADIDAGDGPAVLVIALAGAVLVPVMLILMFAFKIGALALILIMTPLTFVTCIYMLRPMKATLFALQRHKSAGQIKHVKPKE